ncbi:oligosaccharide flippase family protein [Rhodococcus sp. NPDC047139]|uniref:oligosaccharide flippase family protein n=1 Tax=Rhodococcus sp. NPDC047139 TaxID=3155141 RepID=UPI0033D5847A
MRSQVAILFGARAVASLSQAVALILLARWTDVSSFALVGSLLGAGMVAVAVLDLGLGTYVLRHGAIAGDEEKVGSALKLNVVTGAIGLAVIGAALAIAAHFDPRFYAMIPLAAWMTLEKNSDVLLNVAIARGSTSVAAYSILTRRMASLLVFLALAGTGVQPLWAFTASLALGGVVGLLDSRRRVYARIDRFPSRRLTRASAAGLFDASKHYWSANLSNQFRNLDTVLVTSISSSASGAFYAAAVRLTNPLLLGTGSLASVILPVAAKRNPGAVRRLNQKLLIGIAVAVPALTLLGWPLAHLGSLILGGEYANARSAIHATFVGTFIIGMCPVVGAMLQSQGGHKSVGRIGVMFVPVILLAVSIGSIVGGAVGAAIGLGIAFLLKLAMLEVNFVGLLRKQDGDMRRMAIASNLGREISDEK